MIELIPVKRVFQSVLIYDEMVNLQDPLYREARMESIQHESMATHRSYIGKILPRHTNQDDLQVWMIHCLASLWNRVADRGFSHTATAMIHKGSFPDCLDAELQLYRETLLKLLT